MGGGGATNKPDQIRSGQESTKNYAYQQLPARDTPTYRALTPTVSPPLDAPREQVVNPLIDAQTRNSGTTNEPRKLRKPMFRLGLTFSEKTANARLIGKNQRWDIPHECQNIFWI